MKNIRIVGFSVFLPVFFLVSRVINLSFAQTAKIDCNLFSRNDITINSNILTFKSKSDDFSKNMGALQNWTLPQNTRLFSTATVSDSLNRAVILPNQFLNKDGIVSSFQISGQEVLLPQRSIIYTQNNYKVKSLSSPLKVNISKLLVQVNYSNGQMEKIPATSLYGIKLREKRIIRSQVGLVSDDFINKCKDFPYFFRKSFALAPDDSIPSPNVLYQVKARHLLSTSQGGVNSEFKDNDATNKCTWNILKVDYTTTKADSKNFAVRFKADIASYTDIGLEKHYFTSAPTTVYHISQFNNVANNSLFDIDRRVGEFLRPTVAKLLQGPFGVNNKQGKIVVSSVFSYPESDVTIAILDTGIISADNMNIAKTLNGGGSIDWKNARNFTFDDEETFNNSDPRASLIWDDYDPRKTKNFDTTDPDNSEITKRDSKDWIGHGTMVAALASLAAPNARILPLKVCNGAGECSDIAIAKGICYALNHSDPKKLVINLSFAADTPSFTLTPIIEYALNQGASVVVAAGNRKIREKSGSTITFDTDHDYQYPAANGDQNLMKNYPNNEEYTFLPGLISVAAGLFDTTDTGLPCILAAVCAVVPWQGSGRGDFVDVTAPGGYINGTDPNLIRGKQPLYLGTSFATALVSGVVATCRENHPDLDPIQLRKWFKDPKNVKNFAPKFMNSGFGIGLIRLASCN